MGFVGEDVKVRDRIIPKTNEDICLAIAEYCAKNNLQFEFIKRTHPVIAIINERNRLNSIT